MLLSKVIHALVAVTVVSFPLFLLDGSLFAWHPVLMAVGFLGLMAEGVLTSISFRSLEGAERLRRIWAHFAWQAAASVCIAGGFWAIYQNKVNHGKPHFKTVHGKFGLTTLVGAALAVAGGAASFRRFGLVTRLPERLQLRVKWAHRSAGMAVWQLSLVTIELALVHPAVWKGWISVAWQAAVAGLGAAVALLWWQGAPAAAAAADTERWPEQELSLKA